MKTKGISYNKVAILTRTKEIAKRIEQYLIRYQIPYELAPNIIRFLERKEIKLAHHFMLALGRPNDNVAFETMLKTLKGLGDTTLKKLKGYAKQEQLSLYQTVNKVLFEPEPAKKLPKKRKPDQPLTMLEQEIMQTSPKKQS